MKKLMMALVSGSAVVAFGTESVVTNRFVGVTGSSAPKATQCRELSGNSYPSPFGIASAWSDNQVPHYGPVYVAGKTNGASSVLWTPITVGKEVHYDMFKTLILETGCTFCIRHGGGKAAIFDDLRIEGSPSIWGPSGTLVLGGKITLADDARLDVCTYNNKEISITSEIEGNGDIRIISQNGTDYVGGKYELYGLNSKWLGKIEVRARVPDKENRQPSLSNYHSTLSITNVTNLGGALNEFTYDALKLMYYSKLQIDGKNLVLPKNSNRGILISSSHGRINVPETSEMFTLNSSITLTKNVHFYKEGEGRLILGDSLRFLDKNGAFNNTSPDENCDYYIDIRGGAIAITHCDALNGAHIAFSNNTEMVMSIDIPEGDLKRYGMRCDKTDEAFATDVPIKLVESEKGSLTESKYSVALTTVKKEYAEDALEKISVELVDVNNYKLLGVRTVANEKASEEDEETVTLYADILHNGLVISVR